jgi:hypothetical protein
MQIASELYVSSSTVNVALRRAENVRLYSSDRRRVNVPALSEALFYGSKYFLGPIRGGITRGVPTSWAASPMINLVSTNEKLPPVWPDAEGSVRGVSFEPLHGSVTKAIKKDPLLYELLSLVDVFREGNARECQVAREEFDLRMPRS